MSCASIVVYLTTNCRVQTRVVAMSAVLVACVSVLIMSPVYLAGLDSPNTSSPANKSYVKYYTLCLLYTKDEYQVNHYH